MSEAHDASLAGAHALGERGSISLDPSGSALTDMTKPISFVLNYLPVATSADPAVPLLCVLREELGLTGTKRGCDDEGECAACTILLDGQPVRACLTPVGKVAGRAVLTVEGLASANRLHSLQEAFVAAGAGETGMNGTQALPGTQSRSEHSFLFWRGPTVEVQWARRHAGAKSGCKMNTWSVIDLDAETYGVTG